MKYNKTLKPPLLLDQKDFIARLMRTTIDGSGSVYQCNHWINSKSVCDAIYRANISQRKKSLSP